MQRCRVCSPVQTFLRDATVGDAADGVGSGAHSDGTPSGHHTQLCSWLEHELITTICLDLEDASAHCDGDIRHYKLSSAVHAS